MAIIPYQPFDFGAVVQAGARAAEIKRENERFALQKEDRQYAREQEQKKEEFARRSRELAAVALNEADPAKKMKAYSDLATHSPKDAMELQAYETKQLGARSDLQTEQLAQQKARESYAQKNEVEAASIWKPALLNIEKAYEQDPVAAQAVLNREVMNLHAARRAKQAVDPNDNTIDQKEIDALYSLSADPSNPAFLGLVGEKAARSDMVINSWAEKEKAAAPFRPGATVLDAAREFSALAAKRGIKIDENLVFGPQGAAYALATDPELWAEVNANVDKTAASRGSVKIVNEAPRDPSTAEIPAAAKGRLMDKLDYVNGYLEKTAQIKKTIAPEYFGAEGAVKGFATKAVGYFAPGMMPDNWNDWVDAKRELQTFSTMSAYDIMVALSGKAITEPERKLLLAAAGDVNTMTMREYSGAVDAMEKVMLFSKKRLERELTPGGGMEYVDDPGVQAWMDAKAEKIVKDQENGIIDDKETNRLLKKVQTDGLYRLMGVRARKRLSTGPVQETPENAPSSATMKTPAVKPMTAKEIAAAAKANPGEWPEERLKAALKGAQP